jgi:predicted unusual protein kinase regulating ubiquinone biosynthesis (AarF/ABC1/UbiB family)
LKQNNNSTCDDNDILEQSRILQAMQLREALTNLGPAFIKAGQQLAIRPDLVPPVVLKELQKLCDSVRPIPDEIALQVLRQELQLDKKQIQDDDDGIQHNGKITTIDDIFEDLHFVASASLGQVYKAKLKETGDYVAIKVRRTMFSVVGTFFMRKQNLIHSICFHLYLFLGTATRYAKGI